jgi:hypothetical protein
MRPLAGLLALSLLAVAMLACGNDDSYTGGGRRQPSALFGLPAVDAGDPESLADGSTDDAEADPADAGTD